MVEVVINLREKEKGNSYISNIREKDKFLTVTLTFFSPAIFVYLNLFASRNVSLHYFVKFLDSKIN